MAFEMICIGCKKSPDQLPEYIYAAEDEGMTPSQYVRREEGTFNPSNGHFCCTECYIKIGEPTGTAAHGWVAP